ncbi:MULTISPECIES: response regulator [unclassified Pseudomonas]|uniref:response regulator n=1 Tax=unclassified Pseudomonas TaxID=196821 RepID=UPI000D38F5F1|nr:MULTISPECIES: response regulator [unclassified Pseudomonas]RAU44398.1 response regulator [Pseudomonas sp. RIT 409]RAU50955.1 response regulator [Pseudomonas sp. RIT 412]
MTAQRGWNISTRTQILSLGPALLLTLLLISFFTVVRIQDLRQELTHTGQLIANQLAPASEYGVIVGNEDVLESLMKATMSTPHVRFLEVQDSTGKVLVHVEQATDSTHSRQLEVFQAPIRLQRVKPADELDDLTSVPVEDYLGRVLVGMSSDAFNIREQEILLKAGILALFALLFTYILARRLSLSLSQPISAMSDAVKGIQHGDYTVPLPVADDAELGDLARHINNLALGLEKASREQKKAMDELIRTREEAERANNAKSEFLAMMSHELRTPMNGVLGMLQLMETTRMTEEQAEYAALATESTEHLLRVINDILDFSRFERDALELENISFNLADLIATSVQAFAHNAQQRGLALELDLPPGMNLLRVKGDPTRIRQILVNLIGNALKFTEFGSVRVETAWQQTDSQHVLFTCAVRDSGIGISAQLLESMFDAFQQADNSISRRYGGTGLGLPIARNLAERMGGSLLAQSSEGIGSVFTLRIPLLRVAQEDPSPPPGAVGELPQEGDSSVLLVEDNPVNRTVVEAMLRSLGLQVSVAGDGAQAVSMASKEKYALILMDCRLPVMDGYEATRRIRALPGLESLPIIALTANARHGDRDLCLQAGMNDYLAKPFKRTDLQQVLQRWLTIKASATGDK